MAKNTVNKYVWLVDTIYKAKKISFEDINRRWLENDMSEGDALSIRTFHKWRIAIEEMFGLVIENEQGGQYRYYIQNADELKNGSMRSWLFNTLTVSNLMLDSVSIKDKVLFEEIPDGEQYLPVILEALKKNFTVEEKGTEIYKPSKLHNFSLYLSGKWYSLTAKPGTFNDSDPIGVLDVTISSNLILDQILGIKDLRSDKRIDFVGGLRGLGELKRRVDSGEMKVALALYPVSMRQLIDIADSGNIMPPKTTWFEPKLRSGLVIHKLV